MESIIQSTTETLFESIKDVLFIIDQGKLDQINTSIIFDKLNKIIIASTLMSRLAEKANIDFDSQNDILEIKLRILSILKLISRSIKTNEFSSTHDLITLELRDSLVKWIIQTIPRMRQGLTAHLSGLTQISDQVLAN